MAGLQMSATCRCGYRFFSLTLEMAGDVVSCPQCQLASRIVVDENIDCNYWLELEPLPTPPDTQPPQ
jgi:hypothetical protein